MKTSKIKQQDFQSKPIFKFRRSNRVQFTDDPTVTTFPTITTSFTTIR